MNMYLEKAGLEQKQMLGNLYSLYLHDLTAYSDGLQIGEDGIFEFDSFELIWRREGVTPYIIRVEDQLAGFILILEAPFTKKVDKVVNDFFILNSFRGKGIAKAAALEVFVHNKGRYYISQLVKNKPAVQFWKKVYSLQGIEFVEQTELQDGEEVIYQTFVIE